MCYLRMYSISMLQGGITIFRESISSDEYELRMSFLFGYVIIGNIVDNVSSPKILAILL